MNIKSAMKYNINSKIKLNLEPAFQTIYLSSIFISFCVAIVFTTTAESLNWGTAFFIGVALVLLYLKKETYLTIDEDKVHLQYFAGLKKVTIPLTDLKVVLISNPGREIRMKLKSKKSYIFYLNKHNQQYLIDYLKKNNLKVLIVN